MAGSSWTPRSDFGVEEASRAMQQKLFVDRVVHRFAVHVWNASQQGEFGNRKPLETDAK